MDRIWWKVGGREVDLFTFGYEGKHHDSRVRKTVELKIEATIGSVFSGLGDTVSGAVPHSLESLKALGRKMKVKNIQAIHELPRKPTFLLYREERSQVIPKQCLNGTGLRVLTKEY